MRASYGQRISVRRDTPSSAPPKSLLRNFSWTLGGNVISAASKALVLVTIAKLGSPLLVGRYSLGLAICAPVILFMSMQLNALQSTDATDDFEFGDYFGLRLVGMAISLVAIAIIVFFTVRDFNSAAVILLIGLMKAVDAVSDVLYGAFQAGEQMNYVARSQILRGIFHPLAVTLPLLWLESLPLGVVMMLLVSVLTLIYYDARAISNVIPNTTSSLSSQRRAVNPLSPRFDYATARTVTLIALPLAFVSLLDSVNANLPRYFLQTWGGEEAVGYFSAIAFIMVTGATVMTSLSYAVRPRLATYFVTDSTQFRRLHIVLICIGLIAGIIGIVVAQFLGAAVLAFLYTAEYVQYTDVLSWVMVAAAVWYVSTCVAIGVTAARIFRIQAPILLATTITTAAAGAYLIPEYGIVGAAWALCAGFAVRLSLLTALCFKYRLWSSIHARSVHAGG